MKEATSKSVRRTVRPSVLLVLPSVGPSVTQPRRQEGIEPGADWRGPPRVVVVRAADLARSPDYRPLARCMVASLVGCFDPSSVGSILDLKPN